MGGGPCGRQGRGMAVAFTLLALSAQLFCGAAARHSTSSFRKLAQAGTNTVVTNGNAVANSGNNNFVGAAQQAINDPNNAQNANLAAKQLVTSATGNQQVNSNDLNSLIQGVRLTQTFSQYLQSLAGASTKQTSLHSTMDNENIVGLYKQQQNDDQFKVGSPSGSVFWTAGNEPVPAPAQAVADNFVTAVAPSLNDVTNSLIALIPSPPPPPPPPTVIQALAPIEEDVSNRISSFLTESGNNAKKGASSASNTNGQASSFQQQAALPTISVPTTFTHEAYSGDGSSGNAAGSNLAGRKLKQSYTPQQQQQWAPATNNQQQQAQYSPPQQQQQQQWAPASNTQQQAQSQQQQQWTPASSTQQQWAAPAPRQWVPASSNGQQQQQQQQQYSPPAQQQQWAPNTQSQQTFGTYNDASKQQSATPHYTGATSQVTQNSGIQDAKQWPSTAMVQLSDGRWVPSTPPPQQAPPAAQTNAAPGTGTGQASPYTAAGSNTGSTVTSSAGQQQQQQQQYAGASGYQGTQSSTLSATVPAPAPATKSPSAWTFPPVTVNGVNLPGWSLPKWNPGPPAPPLGPAPAMAVLPQAPRPLPLPVQLPAPVAQSPSSSSVASFQSLTNTQGQPLTKSLAGASSLPELQQIGANTGNNGGNSASSAAQQQPTRLQSMGTAPAQQPGPGALPGFPAQGPALPQGNLMWVNVGGQKSG